MKSHKFIFIGGLHRSGTSLLSKCLSDHPEISGFKDTGVSQDEGQLLQSVYPPAKVYGGPGVFGFDPASYLNETSPLISSKNAEKLFLEWGKYWTLNRPFLLEKSPPNLIHSRFLQALFPNSYFIMILRHPIAVSYATQKWSKSLINSLIAHWLVCHEKFYSDQSFLKNLIMIKYEDFVSEPYFVMKRIYEFLDAEPIAVGREVKSNVNEKYFSIWKKREKGILTRRYTRHIIDKYESRVNAFGYSLKI